MQVDNRASLRQYGAAAVGLAAVVFTAFAAIWPYNGAAFDDWVYLYFGDIRALYVPGSNRMFGIAEMVFSEVLLPGRTQMFHYLHVLNVIIAGLLLFHLTRRFLPQKSWFAFFYAAVYVLYIPNNLDHARALYAGNVNTWVTLMGLGAVVLLVEHLYRNNRIRWIFITAGALLAYAAIRAFESMIPLMGIAPLLLIFLRPERSRRFWTGLAIWYVAVGVGTVQFLAPFLSSDSAVVYQTVGESGGIGGLIQRILFFYQQSFPIHQLFEGLPNYLAPSLLLMIVFSMALLLFWRRERENHTLPDTSQYGLMVLVGLPLVGMAGAAGAYAGFPLGVYRFNYFAAPAQALVVVGIIGLLSVGLSRIVHLRPISILAGFALIYALIAGHWYFNAQLYGEQNNAESRSFDESIAFFRDVVALAPNIEPHTLILYTCPDNTATYQWQFVDGLAAFYLYDDVRMNIPGGVNFGDETVTYNFPIEFYKFEPVEYRYDEIIMLGCSLEGPTVLDTIPPGLVPADADIAVYAPYSRISDGFPDAKRRQILGF